MAPDTGPAAMGPMGVREHDHVWIPMPDGTRLAARIWLPETAPDHPVPALFEYIPYRKADMVRARDERNHPFFASHGYACLRVDMRGSGDSEGVMTDMYAPAELDDARRVIDWIAAQPWCTGRVGMFGTSWGGTAALQANVDAPRALKAVIAVCATHDRYEDDIHHMGGAVLTDTLEWGVTLPAILAAPPTPNVGPGWKAAWRARLAALGYPLEAWLREEARGSYWRHGSVIHEAPRLTRPILAIGGWADRYSNSVMALADARPDLVWGVVGPWGHHYPDHGHPGPAMGFQTLALEWWDRWLGPNPAPPEWPRLRVWLREFERPANAIDHRAGGWIETAHPAIATRPEAVTLSPGTGPHKLPSALLAGRAAGDTGYFGRFGGLPTDQRLDDAGSLAFDIPTRGEERSLFGAATLDLTVSSGDHPGQIAARLLDIAPDGTAALIVRTVRNLALDDALEPLPRSRVPEKRRVRLRFPTTAYRLRAGHGLCLALSASYWPLVWPSRAGSPCWVTPGRLTLPVLTGPPVGLSVPLPPAADLPPEKTHRVVSAPGLRRTSTLGPERLRQDAWHQPHTEIRYPGIDTTFGYETEARFEARTDAPQSPRAAFAHRAVYTRPDGTAIIQSTLEASSDSTAFLVEARLDVRWNGDTVLSRDWHLRVPRSLC